MRGSVWRCDRAFFPFSSQLTVVPAIDVWAAGTILLFFLTGKFPLFQSNDDMEALLELSTILGRREMEYVATLHCKSSLAVP